MQKNPASLKSQPVPPTACAETNSRDEARIGSSAARRMRRLLNTPAMTSCSQYGHNKASSGQRFHRASASVIAFGIATAASTCAGAGAGTGVAAI